VETWGLLVRRAQRRLHRGRGAWSPVVGLGAHTDARLILMLANFVNWIGVRSVHACSPAIVLLSAVGMLVWITIMPVIEAAEQTVLQRVGAVRTARVGCSGSRRLVENAASRR
jgi:hypothetical protein